MTYAEEIKKLSEQLVECCTTQRLLTFQNQPVLIVWVKGDTAKMSFLKPSEFYSHLCTLTDTHAALSKLLRGNKVLTEDLKEIYVTFEHEVHSLYKKEKLHSMYSPTTTVAVSIEDLWGNITELKASPSDIFGNPLPPLTFLY